jgi:hypothetical protein
MLVCWSVYYYTKTHLYHEKPKRSYVDPRRTCGEQVLERNKGRVFFWRGSMQETVRLVTIKCKN